MEKLLVKFLHFQSTKKNKLVLREFKSKLLKIPNSDEVTNGGPQQTSLAMVLEDKLNFINT